MEKILDITDFGKSSANMKSKFMSGLRKRFDVNRVDDVEPSPLNAGVIGYMVDMYGNAVEDHFFHVNSRAKEMFVTCAKFDDSIYMQASVCQMSDFFATPAVVDLLLVIPVEDIVDNAVLRKSLGYSMLTLGGKTQFILDKFYYLIDYPIDIIVKKSSSGEDIISCRYQIDKYRNQFSDLEAAYIPGQVQTISSTDYYVFKVRAHQLGLTEYSFAYTTASNATDVYEYTYEAQLAGFRVWCQSGENSKWELLENKYNGVLTSTKKKFCYFRLLDKKIEISFSNDPADWKPNLNDKFKIQIFESEGASANFEYSAYDVTPYLFQDSSSTYENAFSGIIPVVQLCSATSCGGLDMPTIDDLRRRIIDFKSSRDTIISENDLTRAASKYGLNIIKHRYDIEKRQFVSYALIKDPNTGFILPGRTGELYIPESQTKNQSEVQSRLIDPNNVYQFWLSDDKVSYNSERFIAKQPSNIRTAVTAKTNYYKMGLSNSHNIEIADNSTEKATIISLNNKEIYFGGYTSIKDAISIPDPYGEYSLLAFYGKTCLSAKFLGAEYIGRTVFVRSMTLTVKVTYPSDSIKAIDVVEIIPKHEYKFVYESKDGWSVTDLGEIGSDPEVDNRLIPSIDHVDIPSGIKSGTSFIFKNSTERGITLNYYDYATVPKTAKAFYLKPKNLVKFDWNGHNWIALGLGSAGEVTTPTKALMDKNWNMLYNYYTRYKGVLMMCPYLIKVFKNPYFVSLYNVRCDTRLSPLFRYNNHNSPEKFAITGISIVRSDIRCNSYKVSCDVAVSDTVYSALSSGNIGDFPVKVKVELFDKKGITNCFFELQNVKASDVANRLTFSTELVTDNVLHQEDMIRIINRNHHPENADSANVMPTNDKIYTGTGIIPNTWFIPFKSRLKMYILYMPDVSFKNEHGDHILEKSEKDRKFVVTDVFETEEQMQFVTDVSDIFSTTLEVIKEPGILPKYPANIPMKYDTIVYKTDESGKPVMENNEYVILHNIGDPVLDKYGKPIYAHKVGEDVLQKDSAGNLIYEVLPETVFVIKNLPLVSIIAMLDSQTKTSTYRALKNITDNIQKNILPKLIENNQIVLSVYNTVGPSKDYAQGSKNTFIPLESLNVSIELNVKFKDSITETETIISSIKLSVENYMNKIIETGYFYASELLKMLKDQFPDVEYFEFGNINGADSSTQTIKRVESKEVQIKTPEYITIDRSLNEDKFKEDGTVVLIPNITINTII